MMKETFIMREIITIFKIKNSKLKCYCVFHKYIFILRHNCPVFLKLQVMIVMIIREQNLCQH